MPFGTVSMMDSRRKLVLSASSGECSLSAACREAGVTRKTGLKWVKRAREVGIENLAERSRAPRVVAGKTERHVELELVALKQEYPFWGAKKLVRLLDDRKGILLPVRTADRILERNGLTTPKAKVAEPSPFERQTCGALLQMDFKGLPPGMPYALLTVLDDRSRFCSFFGPVPDRTGPSVVKVLWEMFGVHGLPDEMLMDNGDCWGSLNSKSPSRFEAWLMRLGIHPIHGRPRHPQTQGKVERFHLTAKDEMKANLIQPDADHAQAACQTFVDRYNWVRPHESLGLVVPGRLYSPWPRRRPETPPKHEIPEGAVSRSVDPLGIICYKGREYRVGKGLAGERVELREAEFGVRLYYASFPLAYIHELCTR